MNQPLSVELVKLQMALAGRYSLEREIGRGGMGVVYLAREVALDRPVAIKVLPPKKAKASEVREQFLREARTAAKFSHPNVVPIFSVEQVDDFVFFVMAYVDGETLGQRLASRGALPPEEVARIMREVAWALAYAHAQGVVHKDVKPDNILLEDGTDRVLVTDFGIAQVAGAATGRNGEVHGTPEFMSPEQATGEAVDHRSDIYSLGVVGFTALAGQPPFLATAASEVLAQHIGKPPPKLTSVAPGVPRRLAQVIERCLAKDPEERIPSCEKLAEALGGAVPRRKDSPPAVRAFLAERKAALVRNRMFLAMSPWLLLALAGLVFGPFMVARLVGVGLLGAAIGWPLTQLVRGVRRLIRAGYGQYDVVNALQLEAERRQEELVHVYGKDYKEEARKLRGKATAWLGAAVGLLAVIIGGQPPAAWPVLVATIPAVVGLLAWRKAESRTDHRGGRELKFWRGPVGYWLVKLAGKGIDAKMAPAALTNRPTEIAIGAVVEGLYASLPKEARESLSDLPDIVQGLEADAQRMRSTVDELDGLLAGTGRSKEGSDASGDAAADRVRTQIVAARDRAQHQLSETVAALENLRIDLLRLRAGNINLEGVTANLGSARDLTEQVDRLLEGYAEAEAILG